jgi:hypothetical protein
LKLLRKELYFRKRLMRVEEACNGIPELERDFL